MLVICVVVHACTCSTHAVVLGGTLFLAAPSECRASLLERMMSVMFRSRASSPDPPLSAGCGGSPALGVALPALLPAIGVSFVGGALAR